MRFDGERRHAVPFEIASADDLDRRAREVEEAISSDRSAALVYGLVADDVADAVFSRLGCVSIGAVPELVRPLRIGVALGARPLPRIPLLLPFGRKPRSGVREILVDDPRVTRLWDRFSIDIGVSVERNARWLGPRIFGRPDAGYRVFVFEDGDRYVIRALCIWRITDEANPKEGFIVELLHDRSLTGMRAASHLVGLALREMSDAGVASVRTWSLTHSGSFPIFARHAFLPARAPRLGLRIGVRALDPAVAHLVEERPFWYLSGLDSEKL